MKPLLPRDMVEATRLTRAGRLSEAVSLLQGMLRGTRASDSPETRPAATVMSLPAFGGELLAEDVAFDNAPEAAANPAPAALRDVFDRLHLNMPALRGVPRRALRPDNDIAPAAGRYVALSFSNEAGSRAYKLYIPSRHDEG